MLAKLKPIRNFTSLTLLICGIASNISAYNIQDVQTLAKTKQCINCDFENYTKFWKDFHNNLNNINVSGSNLRGIKLSAYLDKVNFSNTDLSGSKLRIVINMNSVAVPTDSGVNLSNFSSSNFSEATFLGDAYNVDFSSSNFYKLNANIDNDEYDHNLQSTLMSKIPLYIENSNFTGSSFREANLFNVVFYNSDFTDVDFTDANLNGTNFQGSKITVEQLKLAKDICYLRLSDGNMITGRLLPNGQIKMCDGFVYEASIHKKTIIV